MKILAHGLTDVGRVRNVNQDALLIDQERSLFLVADGMGGHAGGEIASSLCIRSIRDYLDQHAPALESIRREPNPDPRVQHLLANAINFASAQIYEKALENPDLRGMGTTATLVKVDDHKGYIAHVGDSRIYILRCGFIYRMTIDHSLVSEQVRAGLLTEEEAAMHQLRNVITRSVGYQEEEEVDTYAVEFMDKDLICLCSDGLYNKVTDQEIASFLERDKIDAVGPLIDLANERGGDDNITVIVMEIKDSA